MPRRDLPFGSAKLAHITDHWHGYAHTLQDQSDLARTSAISRCR